MKIDNYKIFFLLGGTAVLFLCSILIFTFNTSYAQKTKSSQKAGELRKAEKGLKDNQYYFYFLNSSVTNFGSDAEKKIFKEAAQRDIIAQLLFMKYLFKESFIEIRKSQRLLIDVYRKALKKDIRNTELFLNELAPSVVESKRKRAVHYLGLGYRDMKVAEVYMTMADHYRAALYSMRLYKYAGAIKLAKHGKRYGFLALIASKMPPGEERYFKNPGFEEIKENILKYAAPEKRDYYTLLHLDNYYMSKGEKSFYDILWEKPDIHEIEDYQNYLNEKETDLPEDVFGR